MEAVRTSSRQLKFFHLENPLSVRLGNDFFRSLPAVPGVYFFYGQAGELLYIGQSSDLKARIGSYRHVTPEKNPRRTLRLVHRIFKIEWRECALPAEAIELERVLLLEHRPPFNRAGVWKGDPWWFKIEISSDKLHLELTREASGTGPHPPAFRYVLGSLVRCLYRSACPQAPLSAYPHRLFDASVPLTLSLCLPDIAEAAETLRSYATGAPETLLSKLESMPRGASLWEQEYWQEELERLIKYAAKNASMPASPPVSPAPPAASLYLKEWCSGRDSNP
ncbi:nucleotide excision repair endonuclease [Prosthecobacter sp.]|uniref:nucleotide excision repair endonuclease n=1 Tax=Prosthecobacter sp. TaxID=1965333 RepID=UPI003784EC1C